METIDPNDPFAVIPEQLDEEQVNASAILDADRFNAEVEEADSAPNRQARLLGKRMEFQQKQVDTVRKRKIDPLSGTPVSEESRLSDFFTDGDDSAHLALIPSTEHTQSEQPGDFLDTALKKMKAGAQWWFNDDMAILGITWDEQGFHQAWDTASKQWSDHPVMSTITAAGMVAGYVFPAFGVWRKSAKVGMLARQGILGGKSRSLLLSETGRHADEIKAMAFGDEAINEVGKHKFFDDETLEFIKRAGDDELEKAISRSTVRTALLDEAHMRDYMRLQRTVSSGKDPITGREASTYDHMKYSLQRAFSNSYFTGLYSPDRIFISTLDDFYRTAGLGRYFQHMPDEKHGKDIYRYLVNDASIDDLRKAGMGESELNWARSVSEAMDETQLKALQSGRITQEMFDQQKNIAGAPRHVPALLKDTPGATEFATDEATLKASRDLLVRTRVPRGEKLLSSPTMKERKVLTTREKTLEALSKDKLLTAPKEFTLAGLVRDRVLQRSYEFVRDMVLEAGTGGSMATFVKTADEVAELGGASKKYWKNLDELAPEVRDTVRRMLGKELGATFDGPLPAMHVDVFDQFFGKAGMLENVQSAHGLMEILTSLHKTTRTALNPATQMTNLAGNLFGFLPMGGLNVLTNPQALREGKVLSKAFQKIAVQSRNNDITDVMTYENLAKIFGDDRFLKTPAGHSLDLAAEFSQTITFDLLEGSAFESVEGLKAIRHVFDDMEKMEARGGFRRAPDLVAKKLAQIFTKFADTPGISRGLHVASSTYLGADMVPKMMLYLDLRKKGLSMDAVVSEVGRRMPQYQAVGSSINSARRSFLPWVTFPVEAARIMKNNVLDNPIRTMPFLHMPNIAQGLATSFGLGPSYDEIPELREQSRAYAHKPTTVYLDAQEGKAGGALGAFTGATAGFAAGMIVGGPKGAALGATAGGAAVGGLAKHLSKDDDDIRAWVMDFLPQSSLNPGTISPYAEPRDVGQLIKEVSPMEPFSVLMPLINVAMGQGSFGQEIPSTGLGDSMSKALLGLFGFVSPPLLQKYGMKVEGKEAGLYLPMGDLLDSNDGMNLLPKEAGALIGGTTTGLLTAAAMKGKSGLLHGAAGAALGAAAGANLNTRRLMTDMGLMQDPRTQHPGNPLFDMFFNSFAGLPKSWKVDPQNQAFNEQRRNQHYTKVRGIKAAQMRDHLRHGRMGDVNEAIREIYNSFTTEYADVGRAQKEFAKWQTRQLVDLRKLPNLAGLSRDDLIMKLMQANKHALEGRTRAATNLVEMYRQELMIRYMNKRNSTPKSGHSYRGFKYSDL